MKHLLVSLLLLAATRVSAQDQLATEFVRYRFRNSPQLVYVDRLDEWAIKTIKKALDTDTLRSEEKDPHNPDSLLILTAEERTFIQAQLGRQGTREWYRGLFEQGTLIEADPQTGKLKEPAGGWQALRQRAGVGRHYFSAPIFLRSNRLCLFYVSYSCGERCAHGKLVVYRKGSEAWLPWLTVFTWIS